MRIPRVSTPSPERAAHFAATGCGIVAAQLFHDGARGFATALRKGRTPTLLRPAERGRLRDKEILERC